MIWLETEGRQEECLELRRLRVRRGGVDGLIRKWR